MVYLQTQSRLRLMKYMWQRTLRLNIGYINLPSPWRHLWRGSSPKPQLRKSRPSGSPRFLVSMRRSESDSYQTNGHVLLPCRTVFVLTQLIGGSIWEGRNNDSFDLTPKVQHRAHYSSHCWGSWRSNFQSHCYSVGWIVFNAPQSNMSKLTDQVHGGNCQVLIRYYWCCVICILLFWLNQDITCCISMKQMY